jgi:hypothetical protein
MMFRVAFAERGGNTTYIFDAYILRRQASEVEEHDKLPLQPLNYQQMEAVKGEALGLLDRPLFLSL